MTPEISARIARAIAECGSAGYTTPSGPVLDLLTQLLDEEDLDGFSPAFNAFARAKPANAGFVEAKIPGIITNFLVRRRGIDGSALAKWTDANPGWSDNLKVAVRNPARFQQIVTELAEAIKRHRNTR